MQTQISQPKPMISSITAGVRSSGNTQDFCGRQGLDWRNLQGSHISAKLFQVEVET